MLTAMTSRSLSSEATSSRVALGGGCVECGVEFRQRQLALVLAARAEDVLGEAARAACRPARIPSSRRRRALAAVTDGALLEGQAVPVRELQGRAAAPAGFSIRRAARRRHRLGALGALVLIDEGMLEGVLAAVQPVDDEGAVARLHEHAFLRQVEHVDVLHVEHHGAVGIAGMGLHPAHDDERERRQQRAQHDDRPRHAVEADARGHEGIGLRIGRHLAEAQQQPEEQGRGKGGAEVMRHQIGQHLEHHGEGVLLAQRRVEQPHHAVGQQHEQADHQRARQRQRHLLQHMPVEDAEHVASGSGGEGRCHGGNLAQPPLRKKARIRWSARPGV